MNEESFCFLEFEQDGIVFEAGKGFARAKKNGITVWNALDVFRTTPPTKEAVLALHKIFTGKD